MCKVDYGETDNADLATMAIGDVIQPWDSCISALLKASEGRDMS